MLLRYAILGLLDGQELHGYRIKSAFESQIGPLWPLNFGQIYQTLKDLKRRALIEGRFDRGTGHVGRWVYTITPKGRRALDTWLGRSPRRPQADRHEVLIRLLASRGQDLASALAQIERQEHVYREYAAELTAQRTGYDQDGTDAGLLRILALDGAIFAAEAQLQWLAHCANVLRGRRERRPPVASRGPVDEPRLKAAARA